MRVWLWTQLRWWLRLRASFPPPGTCSAPHLWGGRKGAVALFWGVLHPLEGVDTLKGGFYGPFWGVALRRQGVCGHNPHCVVYWSCPQPPPPIRGGGEQGPPTLVVPSCQKEPWPSTVHLHAPALTCSMSWLRPRMLPEAVSMLGSSQGEGLSKQMRVRDLSGK